MVDALKAEVEQENAGATKEFYRQVWKAGNVFLFQKKIALSGNIL